MNIKEINGFPDYYITDCGDVYSAKRGGWKKRKPTPDKDGYLTIAISPDGNLTRKTFKIHRLVVEYFLTSDITGLDVNHKNGVKWDNRMSNLELVTHSQNMKHAAEKNFLPRGEKIWCSKHTEDQIHQACELLQNPDLEIKDVARITGVSENMCSGIYNGAKWQYIAINYDFSKKRRRGGNNRPLSDETVADICRRILRGDNASKIARDLKISYYGVRRIKSGKYYTDVSSQYLHKTPKTIESTS